MSAVPVTTRPAPKTETVPITTGRAARAIPLPAAKPRVKAKSKTSSRLTTFAIIAGLTYLVSSLTGQVMVEKARREGIRAAEKATEARKMVEELNNRLASLKDLPAVDGWAKTHNFFQPDELAKSNGEKSVVVAH